MPRIFTSANEPRDYCSRHFPNERNARKLFGDVGDGPDGRGNCFEYDADHPDYEDDQDMYRCVTCGCRLGERDNVKGGVR